MSGLDSSLNMGAKEQESWIKISRLLCYNQGNNKVELNKNRTTFRGNPLGRKEISNILRSKSKKSLR